MTITPHAWVILKINTPNDIYYRIFAGWRGGYLEGASWKLNSGIVDVIDNDTHFDFIGVSGSTYHCNKLQEGMTGYMTSVLESMRTESSLIIDVVPSDTRINYNPPKDRLTND